MDDTFKRLVEMVRDRQRPGAAAGGMVDVPVAPGVAAGGMVSLGPGVAAGSMVDPASAVLRARLRDAEALAGLEELERFGTDGPGSALGRKMTRDDWSDPRVAADIARVLGAMVVGRG